MTQSSDSTPTPRVVVFADDLTGANDAGAQIAKRGIETVSLLDPGLARELRSPALVFDTESRGLSPEDAREAVRRAARRVTLEGAEIVYKKIDSTLRGNVGAELAALIGELAPDAVVCAPAYPRNGRTTRGGIHRVGGLPLAETEVAADPVTPVRSSRLTEILAYGGGPEFFHIPLEVLRSPQAAASAVSHPFVSFDCETQSDLERIVEVMWGQRGRVLWCGSAGLAEVLIAAHFDAATEGSTSLGQQAAPAATAAGPRVARRPLLAVVGSTSEATQRQLDAATTFGRAGLVRLDPAASFERERRRLAAELRRLEAAPSAPADAPPRLILAAPAERQIVHVVSRCLASAAVAFLEHSPVAGLFLTGGETAYEVARAASVRGMLIEEELFPGIPLVRFLGGKLDGLPGVTKAGGFGDETTLIRSFDAIAALGLRRG